jgi:hypothetical protein
MITSIKVGPPRTQPVSRQEGVEGQVQGLTPEQLTVVAQKVYDLLLEELRIEMERHGGMRSR